MIRAVLFDLDGTLMDSTEAIVDSWFYAFDALGLPKPDRDLIINTIGYPLRQQIPMMTDHDVDECIRVYRGHYTEHSAPKTTLLPGAAETLAALRLVQRPVTIISLTKIGPSVSRPTSPIRILKPSRQVPAVSRKTGWAPCVCVAVIHSAATSCTRPLV